MDDNATQVLEKPVDEEGVGQTQVLPLGVGQQAAGRGGRSVLVTAAGVLARVLVLLCAGLVIATTVEDSSESLWLCWILAVILALICPLGLLIWLRRMLKKRVPTSRIKVDPLSWMCGWNLVLLAIFWMAQPGILTLTAATQGAHLADGMARVTSPDHGVPRAILWIATKTTDGMEALETSTLGPKQVGARAAAAQNLLLSALGRGGEEGRPTRAEAVPSEGADGVGTGSTSSDMGTAGRDGGGGVEGLSRETETALLRPSSVGEPALRQPSFSPRQGDSSGRRVESQPTSANSRGGSRDSDLRSGTSSRTFGSAGVPQPLPIGTTVQVERAAGLGSIQVPLAVQGNLLLVDVVIDRRFPARMRLDASLKYSALSTEALERFGLLPGVGGPIHVWDGPDGQRQSRLTVVPTLALGGLELHGVTAMACDACVSSGYLGVLGNNVLENFSTDIDQGRLMVTVVDQRARHDQRLDIHPFISMDAQPEPASGVSQPFMVTVASRAPRAITRLYGHLVLYDADRKEVAFQEIGFPEVPAGERVSVRAEVPRETPYVYYKMELGEAHW